MNKDNAPYIQSSAPADIHSINSETTRQPQLASRKANCPYSSLRDEMDLRTKFKSIRGFYLDLNHGDSGALKSLLSYFKVNKSIKQIKLKSGEISYDIDEILNEFSSFYLLLFTIKKTVADANYTPREELLNVFELRNSKKNKENYQNV